MKRKINIGLCIIGVLSIILTTLLSVFVCYKVFQKQVFSDLSTYTNIIVESNLLNKSDRELDAVDIKGVRVTQIAKDGIVLYDNYSDPSKMDNHSNRPEVQSAVSHGSGKAVRHSDTLHENTYYYAVRLTDGTILRVAKEAKSIYSMFTSAVPTLSVIAFFLFIISFLMARFFTKGIIRPIEKMASHLDNMDPYVVYDELVPFARIIKSQHEDIINKMAELEQENAKIQAITNYMGEGLLLVDKDEKIVIANPSAKHLLDNCSNDLTGQKVVYLSRNDRLKECIYKALEGQRNYIEFEMEDARLQAFANPVLNEGQVVGAICFIVDVTDKMKNEKMRREFSANVSHELKTPLAGISGYAELISQGIAQGEDVVHFAKEIHACSTRLLKLINDIIEISHLEETDNHAEQTKINLYEVVKKCYKEQQPSAVKRGVDFKFSGCDCFVIGSQIMLEELVTNLCENAIRYNKPNGSVEVVLEQQAGKAVLTVSDTGIGIPKKYQERVFERFFRVDKSRSKETGGTGLGLAIVKHVVQWHNASLQLESTENVGTTIKIIFP
ncbi:phosphate regulon sensor protein PhoR [Lachnospiraceae bacterium KM106-2]|nr:phosphate regulon sensor protein PhoR [Lachnospiraceae bacterium KM106-2]